MSVIVVTEPYGDFMSIDKYNEEKYNERLNKYEL
jgi:hypothetical protein